MITAMILCGGESGEHEVSLQSANSIIQHIPRDKYNVVAVGISKTGEWKTGEHLFINENDPAHIALADHLQPAKLENGTLNGQKIDVVFPIIHGTFGEDGCLQGLLQFNHLPYVGAGILGSSVGMDKDITKRVVESIGVSCAPHVVMYKWDEQYPEYGEVAEKLGDTLFIKPCNLGSSIGISKARNKEEYDSALKTAFKFDSKILVESFVKGREIELAVLGNEKLEASAPGEVIPGGDFYSYETKYIESDLTELKIPAEFSDEMVAKLKESATRIFRSLGLFGMSRVDFFVTSDDKIYLNEVNTLPGFTKISMYPKLWGYSGIPYPELIDRLLELAMDRYEKDSHLLHNRI